MAEIHKTTIDKSLVNNISVSNVEKFEFPTNVEAYIKPNAGCVAAKYLHQEKLDQIVQHT